MLKQPIHRASFLAVCLFGLLLLLTWKPETKVAKDASAQLWPLELELKGDLGGLALTHELVQDTLSFHATRLHEIAPGLRSSWQYQFCCDDPLSMDEGGHEFKGKLSLQFKNEETRRALLRELVDAGYFELKSSLRKDNWTMGRVDLVLPVPGSDQSLVLKDIGFGLQMPAGLSKISGRFEQS